MLKPRDSFAKEYHLKKCVDAKGLAEVWEVASVKNHIVNSVALKIFPWVHTAGIKEIEAEFIKQPYFDHDNLLPAKRLGIYTNRPYLEMHFCNNGNISKKVLQLSENEIAKCMHQISSALAYLHENSVIHGCIKPDNILIDGNSYYLYLADLGLGHELRKTIERFVEVDGDEIIIHDNDPAATIGPARSILPCFCAPELFENNPIATSAADIWAFGASMFEMITGRLPFGYLGGEAQRKNNAVLKDIQQNFSVDFNSLIKKCLSKNKEDRPTAQEIEESTKDFLKAKKSIVDVQPAKPFTVTKPEKPVADTEPAKPFTAFEPKQPVAKIEPVITTVPVEPQKPIIEEIANVVTNTEPQHSTIEIQPIQPVVTIEPKKPITNTELSEPTTVIEPPKPSTDTIEPEKLTVNEKRANPITITEPPNIDINETKELINSIINQSPSNIEQSAPVSDSEPLQHTIDTKKIIAADVVKPINPFIYVEPKKRTYFNEPTNYMYDIKLPTPNNDAALDEPAPIDKTPDTGLTEQPTIVEPTKIETANESIIPIDDKNISEPDPTNKTDTGSTEQPHIIEPIKVETANESIIPSNDARLSEPSPINETSDTRLTEQPHIIEPIKVETAVEPIIPSDDAILNEPAPINETPDTGSTEQPPMVEPIKVETAVEPIIPSNDVRLSEPAPINETSDTQLTVQPPIVEPIEFETAVEPITPNNNERLDKPISINNTPDTRLGKQPLVVEPTKFETANDPLQPATESEPLKQIFFDDGKSEATLKNVYQKKPVNWRTVLSFVLPSVIAGIILFTYIKLSSNSPEYTIKPLPKYIIPPLPNTKKDTSLTKKQQNVINSTIIPKTSQNTPSVKPNRQDNTTKAIVPITKKQKDEKNIIDHGIPKHRDNEQSIDNDRPKHKP